MAANVVSFFRREPKNVDWTRDELAELYRVEHSLVQAGLTLETDRGVTDEGDPWFVFCGPESGGVLIHLTRYEGLYRLYSPALLAPLVGPTLAALTKSFSNQIPLQATLHNRRDAQLFVHPASILAVVVGTIFVASNEVSFSNQTSADKKFTDGWEAPSAQTLKGLLQASYQSYIEQLAAWLRDGMSSQQTSYLAMVSAVAAFIVGTTSVSNLEQPAATDKFEGHADVAVRVSLYDDALNASRSAAELQYASKGQDSKIAGDAAATDDGPAYENSASAGLSHGTTDILASAAPENLPEQESYFAKDREQSRAADTQGSDQNFHAGPNNSFFADLNSAAETANSAKTGSSSVVSNTADSSEALKDLFAYLASAAHNGQTVPTSQTALNDVSSLFAHAVQVDSVGSPIVQASAQTVQMQPTADGGASVHSGPPPMFDADAVAALLNFLTIHPNAEAIYDQHSIVVYDGDRGPIADQGTIGIWQFADGSTIALVGHVDHSLVA